MKILVFSDSHGYTNGMDYAIEKHKDVNYIIHCGDVADDVDYLYHVYERTHAICAVSGNNDFSAPYPLYRIMKCEGYQIYICHGHREHVKGSLYGLESAAVANHCKIAVFGHTHVQLLEEKNGIYLLNPGSIGYFRQEYAILDIKQNDIHITLHKL